MKRMLGFRKMSLVLACLAIIAVILLVSSDTSPAFSQDPSGLITIESNDVLVTQTGNWTSQSAAEASGGSYLYSSGDEDDVLELDFYGSTIEITYTSHPAFGSFAIEVDNTILRTVVATSEEASFGQKAVIDYLVDEPHTVRVFAVDGVIAIDAFTTQLPPPPAPREEAGSPEALTCADIDVFPIWSSRASDNTAANGPSTAVSLSGDGRYVAFSSTATDLLEGGADTNALADVFVYDRLLCVMTRVSVSSSGAQATGGGSFNPSISQDGRYVAFESNATNLLGAGNDINGVSDIFVRDRQTGTTTRVSVSPAGVAGNGHSTNASISNDGQRVAFQSTATNLVGTDTTSPSDVFVRNMATNSTIHVSIATSGTAGGNGISSDPAISGNGQFVAFQSKANNLVAGETPTANFDIFVRDLSGNTTSRVSVPSGGGEVIDGDSILPDISNDGQYVAFESNSEDIATPASEQSHIYVHDRSLTTTTRASVSAAGTEGDDDSNAASISGNGKYVAFYSGATNLVAGDTGGVDVFVKDWAGVSIVRASLLNSGGEPTEGIPTSQFPSMSDSGRNVAFQTQADLTTGNLDDNSPNEDIYVADIAFVLVPSDLIATAVSNEEIALHWNDNTSDELSFQLQRSLSATAGWATIQGSIGANFRDWTDNGLDCETTYYYRISALRPSGLTEYSNVASAKTLLCAVSPPSNVTITAIGLNNMNLSWTDESSSETEFRIYRSADSGETPPFALQTGTVEANVVTFQAVGLLCNDTDYYFYVTAYRAEDGFESEASNIAMGTTPTCPDPGITTLISPLGNSAIGTPTFRFTEAYLTDYYVLEVRNDLNVIVINKTYEPFKVGQVQCSGGECSASPGISLVDGAYKWRIRTYYHPDILNPNYENLWTELEDFSVVPPQPIAPKYPDASYLVATFSDVEFSWDEIPTITYYKLLIVDPYGKTIHDEWYTDSVCAASVCAVTLPKALYYNGWYSWYIRVWSPEGYGPWSDKINFKVEVPAPGAPTGFAVGNDAFGRPNLFSWTNNPEVSYYNVYVQGPGGIWINKWFAKGDPAMTCENPGTCSITSSLGFHEGGYNLYVRAWSTSGQAWSSAHPFTVAINDPATPSGFGLTRVNGVTDGIPQTFTWNNDDNTTWFRLYVARDGVGVYYDKWYEKGVTAGLTCTTTCSASPKFTVHNGTYKWYVQAYGPGGQPWSGSNPFTVNMSVPATPTGLTRSPLSGIPNTFQWTNDQQNATWYRLYINRGSAIYVNTWYEKGNSIMSCTSTCTVVIDGLDLVDGSYTWYVQATGPGGSPWSAKESFVIDYSPPAIPNPLTEILGADGYPDGYSWPDDANATWFNLYVRKGASSVWLNAWYKKGVTPGMVCAAGTCTVNHPFDFTNGSYSWFVRGYGPGGQTWSAGKPFSVGYTAPIAPQNVSVTMTNNMPTSFSWDAENNVQWYRLYVQSSAGVWINSWHKKADICPDTTCSVNTSLAFWAGNYTWYAAAWNPSGVTTWTSKQLFTLTLSTPAAPTLVSPANDFFDATGTIIFKWNTVPYASWYVIQIKSATGVIIIDKIWVNAATACVGGLCSAEVSLSGENLTNATWRVQGYSTSFTVPYGLWSASRTFTMLD